MESHIVIPILRVNQPGHKMFAGMSLHILESSVPVDLTCHSLTDRKRRIRIVDDLSLYIMDCRYMRSAKNSHIIRLSAAFRIECGLVQNHLISLFPFFAGKYFRLECADICGIIE